LEGEVGRVGRAMESMPWHAPSISTLTGSRRSSLGSTPLPIRDTNSVSEGNPIGNLDLDVNELNLYLPEVRSQLQELDNETGSFYVYVETIMRETNSDCIHLEDITQNGTRTTAALAFFNTLALATRQRFQVTQLEPFGEIEIRIL
jgi:hypothetical protein